MSWQTDTINPAVTSPAVDISKITNDLQVLRDTFENNLDPDVPVVLDATKLVGQVPVESLGFFYGRNRLINAQGLINQRGYVSGTATTSANQYTVDRWRVVTSGQNLTFSTSANQVTFTAPAGGIEQVIEGLNLESGTYVLNWEGTATATVGGTAVAKGGTVIVVGGTNTTVRFIGGTFIRPQFEAGSVATPFERRPYGTELALCQRYYQTLPPTSVQFPWGSGTQVVVSFVSYKVTTRVNPTITLTGATGSTATASLASTNATQEGSLLYFAGNSENYLAYTGGRATAEF